MTMIFIFGDLSDNSSDLCSFQDVNGKKKSTLENDLVPSAFRFSFET